MVEESESDEWFKDRSIPWWGIFAKRFIQVIIFILICYLIFNNKKI